MYRTRKVAEGKKEKKEALVFRLLRLHECYSPFPVYKVLMSLFLCFVRAPFKLALLNWMPLDKN